MSKRVSEIEKQNRAEAENRKRTERLNESKIAAAINAIAGQLATNDKDDTDADNRRAIREKVTIFLLCITFASAFAGDVIFWRTMMDARDAQRPLLGLSDKSPPPGITDGNRLAWNVWYVNYGKSPAIGGNIRIFFKFGKHPFECDWLHKCGTIALGVMNPTEMRVITG